MSIGFDVTDGFDCEFLNTFILHRRAETVSSHGRSQVTDTVTSNELGVICSASPNDLQRWPEADISLKSISIVTTVRLQLASPGYKADVIEWGGNFYQVGYVDDYSQYGEGYMAAIAQVTDYTPAPPTADPLT